MKPIQIVKECMAAIEARDFERAAQCLTDDFQFIGGLPKPIGKQEWLGVHKALRQAMPDFKFNLSNATEKEGKVNGQVRLTGTHKGTLTIPSLDLTVLATGKSVALPKEKIEAQIQTNKMKRLEVTPVEGGGLAGIVKQMGVTIPVPAMA